MRRFGVGVFVLATLLLTTGTAGALPTRMQVVADEYSLVLSRTSVPNKRVRIELANFGEDPHNLKVRRIGGMRTFTIGETPPGEQTTKTFDLRPGAIMGMLLAMPVTAALSVFWKDLRAAYLRSDFYRGSPPTSPLTP